MDEQAMMVQLLNQVRDEMRVGFDGLNRRLDISNGRHATNETAIARLQERTKDMVCAEHAAAFEGFQRDLDVLKRRPPAPPAGEEIGSTPWHRDRRTWAGSGIALAGTAALYGLARLFEALAQHADKIGAAVK